MSFQEFSKTLCLKILSVDIISCSHERCVDYFMESIQSKLGFYGWKCESYFKYIFGLCPFENNHMTVAGENCRDTTRGMYLVNINAKYPFAKGQLNNNDDAKAKRECDDDLNTQWIVNYLRRSISHDIADTADFNEILDFNQENHLTPKVTLI